MTEYYDWAQAEQECPECRWRGLGREARIGESFDSGSEYHCPKCNYYFGYIAYPLIKEALNDPHASHEDRLFAQVVEQRNTLSVSAPALPEPIVRSLARQFLVKLWTYFLSASAFGILIFWLGVWADSKSGWEGDVISFLFKGLGTILIMLSFFFAMMLKGWYEKHQAAIASANLYSKDPQAFSRMYREVLGPIPW